MKRAFRSVAFGSSMLLASSSAFAQSAGDKAGAEALFEQARALVSAGKFEEACKKFEASQGLDPGIGTLLNLADCYEKVGRFASAWATFKEAAAAATAAGQTGREELARDLAAALVPKLSYLAIKVAPANPADTEITRDGAPVAKGLWSSPLPVDPGTHVIEARAPGRLPWKREVPIQAPGEVSIDVPVLEAAPAISAEPPAATPPPAPTAPPHASPVPDQPPGEAGSTQRMIGYVVGGAGIVGLGVSVVLGLQAKSRDAEADDHCDDTGCTSRGVELGEQAQRAASLATVFAIGGAALTGGGLVLVLTAPSSSSASTAASLRVAVAPSSVSLLGRF